MASSSDPQVRASPERVGREKERADLLAYLERKRANAERIASRSTGDLADDARSQARALSIAIGDIAAGLHEGERDISS